MKDKLTINIVGVIPVEEIRNYDEKFNPSSYDADETIRKIIEGNGAEVIISSIKNQFNNTELRESQRISYNYYKGFTDTKAQREALAVRNPITGTYMINEEADTSSLRVSSKFHKQSIEELTNFTIGSKPSGLKLNTDTEISDKSEQAVKNFMKRWNDEREMERDSVADYLLFGFSGIFWRPFETKNLLGNSEWRLIGERINPINTFAFTLGRVESKMNNADAVVVYDYQVDGESVVIKAEIFTNKSKFTINYSETEEKEGAKQVNFSYWEESLWIKSSKVVDFIKPPFTFVEADKFGDLLINNYKDLIDAEDRLLNKVIDDSIYHEESLLFIKNSGLGINFKEELEAELAALGRTRAEGQKGYKAIYADNNDADVKNLDNDLPTEHTKLSFEILNNKMYDVSGTLNYNSSSTNENYNAIKMKYNKVLNKIEPIREKLRLSKIESLKTFIKFIKNIDMEIAKELADVIDDVVITFDNGFLINELDQQTALSQAVANRFISRRTASETSAYAAADEYERIKEEEEEAQEQMALGIKVPMDDTREKKDLSLSNREGGSQSGDIRQMSNETMNNKNKE